MAYVLWIFGFLGFHRFYYNSKKIGALYLFTAGLCGVGWLFDLFYLPKLHAKFDQEALPTGEANYTLAWMLLLFGGIFGLHKLYLRRMSVFFFYFFTFGGFGVGFLYDFFTLNNQIAFFNLPRKK